MSSRGDGKVFADRAEAVPAETELERVLRDLEKRELGKRVSEASLPRVRA
jgi:hypothetical protein